MFDVISELTKEKGLSVEQLHDIIKESLLAAYLKKYPDALLVVKTEKDGTFPIEATKVVVSEVENSLLEISLRKARHLNKNIEIGDQINVPFEEPIGRVEILKARQVIVAKIRDIEAQKVYNEFSKKLGKLVHGTVHKKERNGFTVAIQGVFAFLPQELMIPGEKYMAGRPIRALLAEVYDYHRGDGQLIIDRASGEFLKALLEIEIPELYDKLIEVRAIARRAGYKSKIIVSSNDSNVDPVGTCIGVGGSRIKPILKELGGEKIDVISWVNSKEDLVKNALRPAEINRVEILSPVSARAWVSEDQRAFAIGKMGQNVSLASELLDMNIELVTPGLRVGEIKNNKIEDQDESQDGQDDDAAGQ
jgi:N utilization substance protein A